MVTQSMTITTSILVFHREGILVIMMKLLTLEKKSRVYNWWFGGEPYIEDKGDSTLRVVGKP